MLRHIEIELSYMNTNHPDFIGWQNASKTSGRNRSTANSSGPNQVDYLSPHVIIESDVDSVCFMFRSFAKDGLVLLALGVWAVPRTIGLCSKLTAWRGTRMTR